MSFINTMKRILFFFISLLIEIGCTIDIPISEINFLRDNITIYAEASIKLKVSIRPENATNKNLVWSSSNPSIATVDDNGNVTGISPGKSIISVKDSELRVSNQCEITVLEKIVPSLEGLEGYSLSWNDEFDYYGEPDDRIWSRIVWPKHAVNMEEQSYVRGLEAAEVSEGILKIRAYKENDDIKSARIHSRRDFQHGYYEARIKIPKGKGIWPAFWLIGNDASVGTWPLCGEIDILEAVGHMPETVCSNIWAKKYSNNEFYVGYHLPSSRDDFHLYACEVTSDYIKIYVDNDLVNEMPNNYLGKEDYPYNDYMYNVVLNFAFGGTFGGAEGVDYSCLPAVFEVDYVRVFTK